MQETFIIQQSIYKPIIGEFQSTNSGMAKIARDLQSGHLPQGQTLQQVEVSDNRENWQSVLGKFAPAILLLTDPATSLIPEQLTIAGGWCALRTAEVDNLQRGLIVNPVTGLAQSITSAAQVADWIKTAVSFDQVTESIAPLARGEMMAVSEVKLWSKRICQKLGNLFGGVLSSSERERIFDAVETADKTRYRLTQNYINFVTNTLRGQDLIRLPDYQIWQELESARDELFQLSKQTQAGLAKRNGANSSWIQSLSLVWTMYSEPYFQTLKQAGYISGKKFIVAEPANHAIPASAMEADFIYQVYQKFGVYFNRKGINPNTGYAAFIGCIEPNGKNARRGLDLANVPNLSNWEQWLDSDRLSPENNLTLTPQENQLLLWGLNLMPFDAEVQSAIITLADIKTEFKLAKKRLRPEAVSRRSADEIRSRLMPLVFNCF